MLPRAIQYGMTPYQFWHEDMRLYEVYLKAYENNMAVSAYVFGGRVYEAVSISLNNAFAKSKSEKRDYDKKLPDMIKAYNEQKYTKTKGEKEQAEYEKLQKSNHAWI